MIELEQITEEEEDKIEAELNNAADESREGITLLNHSRLPPIYENQRLNPEDKVSTPSGLTTVDSGEIQLEFIRKPRLRRKLSI